MCSPKKSCPANGAQMVIQWCLKGIRSRPPSFEDTEAVNLLDTGIPSAWLRYNFTLPIGTPLIDAQFQLSRSALRLAHVNNYNVVGTTTPYISLSAGVILRDRTLGRRVFSAWKSAVDFATGRGKIHGDVYRAWTM